MFSPLASLLHLYHSLCASTPLPSCVVEFYRWIYVSLGAESHPSRFVAIHSVGQHLLFFYGVALPLLALDVFQGPQWLYKYKLQKLVPPSSQMWRCIRTVLFNQFVLLLPISCFLHRLYQWRGCKMTVETLPSMFEIFVDLLICVLVEEVLFYYSHRALHSRLLYGWVHKQHHEFKAPVGLAAIYAHPIEFLLSNLAPLIVGALVAKSHQFSMWVWYGAAIIVTIFHHCGYAFPWLVGNFAPNDHDWHHEKFEVHYGLLGWLDRLHGTNLIQGRTREEILSMRVQRKAAGTVAPAETPGESPEPNGRTKDE